MPKRDAKNEDVEILWDLRIQTDKRREHNPPDIVIIHKKERVFQIIDVAFPGDDRVERKENEKVDKYRDLAMEIKALWKMKMVKIVPVVIGFLGTIPKRL